MRGEREDRLIEMAAAAHPEPTPSQVTEARGRLRFDRRRPEGGAYDAFDRQFTRRYDGSELFEGQGRIEGVSHAAAATAEGYEVELAIPWSGLGGPPAEGRVLGFDVANNDNDGGRRVAQIVWAGTAFDWRDTAAFGDCLLGDSEGNPPAGVTADPTYTIVAPRAGRPLRVDGRLEEADWRLVGRADASVIGRGNNRVAFGLLWDATALYVGVRVEDRELRHDSARAWEDDSVEVFIDGNHASRPPPPWLAGVRAGLMFPAMSGLLAVALATALRGSPVFHALGISIQTASGRRAGRVRCALRTALAWGPLLVMLLPGVPGGASFGFDVNGPGAVAATLAPPALVLLGALFAVLRPQRGLQDLMAGTVLVRK